MKRRLAVALAIGSFLAVTASAPRESHAFCGFYVAPSEAPLYADATMVSLMRQGSRTAITMSNNYKGPAADFAMVVPVPVVLQKEMVKTLPADVFQKLEALSAPRLVEYWEQDPCYEPPDDDGIDYKKSKKDGAKAMAAPDMADGPVKIEAKFAVGEYDILILSATESDALEKWLIDNKYNIPKGASAALAPYIKEQQKFFVAKVDITKVKMDDKGVAVLSPLRFHYESPDFRLPVRLGLLNAQGKQDLIVYVLGQNQRYEVANYPNVTAPTNLDVSDETRTSFNSFYASLFDATIAKAGGKAVVTEYAWMSNSCDPCPTPPLGDREISLLGGDVLLGMASADGDAGPGTQGDPTMGYYGGGSSIVLTRLHARYDATTLTEDLVFRAAEPIVGGREFVVDQATGALEKGAQKSSMNNFQARYAIRHPWTGPIACAKPRRGVWGGKPGGSTAPLPPATGLAAAKRDVDLASYIVSKADDLGLKADAPPAGAAPPPPPPPPTPWGRVGIGVGIIAFVTAVAYLLTRPKKQV